MVVSRDCLGVLFRPLVYYTGAMFIFFPPSEGKTAPASGPSLDLLSLSFPQLTEGRELVLRELAEVSASADALSLLKLGASLAPELVRNQRLESEPTAPAASVYTGVLFQAFDYASLSAAARAEADRSVLVFSGLWGAVGLADFLPAYRLSMGVKLGRMGDLAKFWRGELAPLLAELTEGHLVLDGRSAAYAKVWSPPADAHVLVKAVRVAEDGSRKVVSHMAKHYRGLLGRVVLEQGLTGLQDPRELVEALSPVLEHDLELDRPSPAKPWELTVCIR